MKKENFICPCCGLPNHLEFKSKDDYDSYLEGQHSSDKFEANPNNYQFNRYILEENEEESDGRKKEIEDRFNLIKDYWNKYQIFEEWFGNEVVGFIPDKLGRTLTEITLHTKIQNILTNIALHILIQSILTEIINHVLIQNILTEIIKHTIYEISAIDKTVHTHYTYTIETEAIGVEVENRRTGTLDIVTNYYPSITLHKEVI